MGAWRQPILATKNKQKILTYWISANADGKLEEGAKRDEGECRKSSKL